MSLQILTLTGSAITPYIPALAQLRIEVFREYPYLYDGTSDYERRYLATYANSPQSLFVLALDGDEVVGVSTGVPLRDESFDFQRPFREAGYLPEQIFYFGESVIHRDYRGRGTGVEFFKQREAYARSLDGVEWCLFCAVDRAEDDPRRPADYTPLDAFWQRQGYQRQQHLQTIISWKELDETQETPKTLTAWMKRL